MAKRRGTQRWFVTKIRSSSGEVKLHSIRAGGKGSAKNKADALAGGEGTVLYVKKDGTKGRDMGHATAMKYL